MHHARKNHVTRPCGVAITSTRFDSPRTIKRTTNAFGEVETESTSSSDGLNDTKLTVAYDKRDKYGNVELMTATDAFGHMRESTIVYDDKGMFPVEHINGLGHKTTQEYDQAMGVLTKQTDPNGLIMQWGYDSLGRLAWKYSR